MTRMKIMGAHVVFHRMLSAPEGRSLCAVLLCKRTLNASVHPAYWGLFGGQLDADEEPDQTALREVQEELGIASDKFTLATLCDVKIRRSSNGEILGLRYFSSALELDMDRLTLQRDPKKDKDKVEGQGLGWFTAEEVHHMIVRSEDRIAVGVFFQTSGT